MSLLLTSRLLTCFLDAYCISISRTYPAEFVGQSHFQSVIVFGHSRSVQGHGLVAIFILLLRMVQFRGKSFFFGPNFLNQSLPCPNIFKQRVPEAYASSELLQTPSLISPPRYTCCTTQYHPVPRSTTQYLPPSTSRIFLFYN